MVKLKYLGYGHCPVCGSDEWEVGEEVTFIVTETAGGIVRAAHGRCAPPRTPTETSDPPDQQQA